MIFGELLAVIFVWLLALQVWDIATLHVRAVVSSLSGAARFIGGCVIGLGALTLLYLTLPLTAMNAFSYLAIATFIAALATEFLIGDDIRNLVRPKR